MKTQYENAIPLILNYGIIDTIRFKHLQAREENPKYNKLFLKLLSLEDRIAETIDGKLYNEGSEIIQGKRIVADWEFEQNLKGEILYFQKQKSPEDFPTKLDYANYILGR